MTKQSNEMDVYPLGALGKDLKKTGKFICTSWFLLFSIGITVFSYTFGIAPVFNATNDLSVQIGITMTLIVLGFVTIDRDLQKLKKQQKKFKPVYVIMVAVFLFMTMYTEVIYFVIDNLLMGVQVFGTEQMKVDTSKLGLQAQMASIFGLFQYQIFFKGKEIWKWITARDEVIERYEKEVLGL